MTQLTANDLKTRGVAAIESALSAQPEATISVRGKERYVVMEVAQYHYLRECELEAALAQSRADVTARRYVQESAQAHAARLEQMLAGEGQPSPARGKARTRAKNASLATVRVEPVETQRPPKQGLRQAQSEREKVAQSGGRPKARARSA